MTQPDLKGQHRVVILLKNEQVVLEAMDQLPPLLDVLASFGGEETIEYPRTPAS